MTGECELCGGLFELCNLGRKRKYCGRCRKQIQKAANYGSIMAKRNGAFPRYSGEKYENTPEKIAEIKAKYKDGVTRTMLNNWITEGLFI